MTIPRFAKVFEGYETIDFREFLEAGKIEIVLRRRDEKKTHCHRCQTELIKVSGRHKIVLEGLGIMGNRTFIHFWRLKGFCMNCKKTRSEEIAFMSRHTPHLTDDYADFIGRTTEIAPVKGVAELYSQNPMTVWRIDFARLKYLLQHYKIPNVRAITVDEIYARKRTKPGENRNDQFFTVINDLNTRRTIWVSESRSKKALDQFFMLIGKEACNKIEVVAIDQHEDYMASVKEHCPKATIVWDKFHLLRHFEEAVNDTRKMLHDEQPGGSEMKRLTRGQHRFLFVKKAKRRTEEEKRHIDDVMKENHEFVRLELIKERMLSFFNEQTVESAKEVFEEIGQWIWEAGFKPLMKWYNNLEAGWDTLKNYFLYRTNSALSEGKNTLIKMLKRRGFGYRNMEYFRLKIMQVAGYLNHHYVAQCNQLLRQIC